MNDLGGDTLSRFTKHELGIVQVRIPMGPTFWMNSYLIPDSDGYSIIDPGMYTEEVVQLWQDESEEIGFQLKQIKKIVVTHHHPDHYGLSGWLQEQSGAPVYLSKLADEQVKALWGGQRPLMTYFLETYRQNGLPAELYEQLKEQLADNLLQVLPHANTTIINEGESIQLGELKLEIIHTPGHAAGHLSFYSEEHELIFVGDTVMPDSLPDTCYVAEEYDANPISSYIETLNKLKRYKVKKAFPGHHQPFLNFSERLSQLEQLNKDRQQKVVEQFTAEEWKTAYEAYFGVFEPIDALIQKRFHYTETLSRVRYAFAEGLIEQKEASSIITYRKLT